MDTQAELEKTPFLVIMQSEEFGNEFFPRETEAEALESIANLRKSAMEGNDGVERIIGFVVNPSRCGVLDGLYSGDSHCEECGEEVEEDYELCDDCQASADENA